MQFIYQAYPDGYELRSQMRLGIDSQGDPAILPYDLDSYVSESAQDSTDKPEGCTSPLLRLGQGEREAFFGPKSVAA